MRDNGCMMVLKIENLSKRYGSTMVVDHIRLDVGQGQVFGLLGPNGSGKTTTLAMILGVIRPDSGSIHCFDSPQSAKSRKRTGALLEKPNFTPWLTGYDNLYLVSDIRGIPRSKRPSVIQEALHLAGLESAGSQKFSAYSLGMKQRLAIASAILGSPELLILDEPTNGIDATGISQIRDLIRSVALRGTTVILASHILDEVERVCSHLAIMKEGRILDSGSIDDVLKGNGQVEVAAEEALSLENALKACPFVESIKGHHEKTTVTLSPDKGAADLNYFLVGQGVRVCSLNLKHKSLESHFLELLRR